MRSPRLAGAGLAVGVVAITLTQSAEAAPCAGDERAATLGVPAFLAYGRQGDVHVDGRGPPLTYESDVLTAARLEYLDRDGQGLFTKEWPQTEVWRVRWRTPIGPFVRGDGPTTVRLRYTQQTYGRPEGCDVEYTRTVTPSVGLAPAGIELTDEGGLAEIALLMKTRLTCDRTRVAPVRLVFRRKGRRSVWHHPDPCNDSERWSHTGAPTPFRLSDRFVCGGSARRCALNLALIGNRSRSLVYRVDAYWEHRRMAGGWIEARLKVHPAHRVWDVPGGDDEFDEYCIEGVNEEVDIPIHEKNGREYCNRGRYVERLLSVHRTRPRAAR